MVQVIFAVITLFTALLGLLCLYIPIERTLRLPPVALTLKLFPTWCWLVAADGVAKLSGFLDIIYLSWLFIAGYTEGQVAIFFFVLGLLGAMAGLGFCALLFTIHGYGKHMHMGMHMYMRMHMHMHMYMPRLLRPPLYHPRLRQAQHRPRRHTPSRLRLANRNRKPCSRPPCPPKPQA